VVNWIQNENIAAAIARGLNVPPVEWEELIQGAIRTIDVETAHGTRDVTWFYEVENVLPLVAASRVLDNASQFAPNLSPAEARHLGLLAAAAFGLCGNFPSATAVIRRTFPKLKAQTAAEVIVMATAAPSLLSQIKNISVLPHAAQKYLEALQEFLHSGDVTSHQAVRELLNSFWARCDAAAARVLAPWTSWCLEHIVQLSTARVLQESDFGSDFIERLLNDYLVTLLPPQWKAITQQQLPLSRHNSLVALPPGTGKTLLGELCAWSAFDEQPGLVLVVTPYVALGRQALHTLQRHLPPCCGAVPVRVQNVQAEQGASKLNPENCAEIVIGTPEGIDALLRNAPQLWPHLRAVICDEAHLIGDTSRGVRLEGLLSRFRLQQESGHRLRIVLLSAALDDTLALQCWMKIADDAVTRDHWRATARRVAIWHAGGQLRWYFGDEKLRPTAAQSTSMLGERYLRWPEPQLQPTEHWVAMQQGEKRVQQNIAFLTRQIVEDYGGPILAVCATRRGARQLAMVIGTDLPLSEADMTIRASIIERIEREHRFLLPICDLLRRGIAWHHAGLPTAIRESIEEAIKCGEIQIVAATTTLAEGVDFPFRFTILADWLHWKDGENGLQQEPMSPWLFRNIAGRCGRAGQWTEGDTIIFDNPLGNLQYTAQPQRSRLLQQLFLQDSISAPQSTLAAFNYETTRTAQQWQAMLASQFLASLAEHESHMPGDVTSVVNWFVSHTYGGQQNSNPALLKYLHECLDEWIAQGLLQHETTLTLTDWGRVVYATDFSPQSAARILQALESLQPVLSQSPTALMARLLLQLGDLPEQNHAAWSKVCRGDRQRFCIKPGDLESIVEQWVTGEPAEAIFSKLRAVKNSSRIPRFVDWLDGGEEAGANWHNELEKWHDWQHSVLEVFLPRLMTACQQLNQWSQHPEVALSWLQKPDVWYRSTSIDLLESPA
jgi:helicase